jgi:hypothetical protein
MKEYSRSTACRKMTVQMAWGTIGKPHSLMRWPCVRVSTAFSNSIGKIFLIPSLIVSQGGSPRFAPKVATAGDLSMGLWSDWGQTVFGERSGAGQMGSGVRWGIDQ